MNGIIGTDEFDDCHANAVDRLYNKQRNQFETENRNNDSISYYLWQMITTKKMRDVAMLNRSTFHLATNYPKQERLECLTICSLVKTYDDSLLASSSFVSFGAVDDDVDALLKKKIDILEIKQLRTVGIIIIILRCCKWWWCRWCGNCRLKMKPNIIF